MLSSKLSNEQATKAQKLSPNVCNEKLTEADCSMSDLRELDKISRGGSLQVRDGAGGWEWLAWYLKRFRWHAPPGAQASRSSRYQTKLSRMLSVAQELLAGKQDFLQAPWHA